MIMRPSSTAASITTTSAMIEPACMRPVPANRADNELAFGADIPDIGDVTEREPDGDHHQRRRFDDDLLQREAVGQGLDEIDVERPDWILAHDREQDRKSDYRQRDRDER